MFTRPLSDNPQAHALNVQLPAAPHPVQRSNRFAQPVASGTTSSGASAAPQDKPANPGITQAAAPSAAAGAAAAQKIQPLPPSSALGNHVNTYA
ncbi:MAG: hypothetical protein K8F27_05940 [Sulfuricellaceae bacterium]|nr:hypothetical protein [Sulfuricellaceae bacterium]